MNCKKCGSPLTENDQFCKNCVATVNAQEEQGGVQSQSQQSSQSDMMQQQPVNNQQYQQPQQNYGSNNSNGWQNSYNPTPNFQQQKPNSNVKYIVIGVVVVVALFAGMFIFSSMKDNGSTSYNGGTGTSVTNTSNKSYKVNFKGFTFTIPDNLVYEENNGVLLIGDEVGSWVTQLEVEQGSFAQLQSKKGQLQAMMQQNGYTCSAAVEKTLGGVNFITMEVSISGQKAIAALAKANAMYFIGITAMNQDNDIDYKLLEKIAPIINSAESTTVTNNMSSNTKLDMSGFAELAK